jgi:enoyl reductase-like protein
MSSLPKIDISAHDVDAYNESVRRLNEIHNHEFEIAKRDNVIADLNSTVKRLQTDLDKFVVYDIKGRMLELIEKKCEDHEGIRDQWTDLLMTLKLIYPDIEAEFKQIIQRTS